MQNPQIHAFHYTETNITRFFCWDSLRFRTIGSTNLCHFSCFSLSSNAHRLVWIASLQVPQRGLQGTGHANCCQLLPTIRDRCGVNQQPKLWISERGFCLWEREVLEVTWKYILRYLKLLETTDIFLQISSQSHHREVLDFTIHNSCHESSQFPRGSIETRSTGYSEISQFRKTINPILI